MDILILPGDDIGPEISACARRVLVAVDRVYSLGLTLDERPIGVAAFKQCGSTVPEETVDAAHKADGVILGPAGMTDYPENSTGWLNVPGTLRKRLDLFANIRPARARKGIPDARDGLDVVIVRENTEGFYADRNMFMGSGEFMPTPDVALSVRKITAQASRRIAEAAFATARQKGAHVTAVGKRHVLQVSDGLFFQEIRKVAENYPDVTWREMDIDAIAADLYSRPDRFQVILITNMFGDILSNAAVAMSGSLGLAAALNQGDRRAMANAGHGSAPDIAGKGLANPSGLILSTAMLLQWLADKHSRAEFGQAASAIEAAVDSCLADPGLRTPDLGGAASTHEYCDAIVRTLEV